MVESCIFQVVFHRAFSAKTRTYNNINDLKTSYRDNYGSRQMEKTCVCGQRQNLANAKSKSTLSDSAIVSLY